MLLALLYQRTAAFRFGPERLVARNRSENLVEIPLTLRFLVRLDPEQIGIVDLAAIGTDPTLAEQRIVRRHFLHLGHDLLRLLAVQSLDSLEVVQDAGVNARVNHGR